MWVPLSTGKGALASAAAVLECDNGEEREHWKQIGFHVKSSLHKQQIMNSSFLKK
jgi:hypothetical protein